MTPSECLAETPVCGSEANCFHCGLLNAKTVRWSTTVLGVPRQMCCAGCAAVAEAIVSNGLEDYYRYRDPQALAGKPLVPTELAHLTMFDNHQWQGHFVEQITEHERQTHLLIDGLRCAACVWLVEKQVRAQAGVISIDINFVTRRARLRWDNRVIPFSRILTSVAAIGYRAHPFDINNSEAAARAERRRAMWKILVAGLGMMQAMMYAFPAYITAGDELDPVIGQLLRWAALVLTLPVLFYSAGDFFRAAWRDLRWRRLGMDVPIALGITVAFVSSLYAFFSNSGEVYFDSLTMFVFFLLCGRYLEILARHSALRNIESLHLLTPGFVQRYIAWPAQEFESVATLGITVGDVLQLHAGDTIPADGVIIAGETEVDEALLSGESAPVHKVVGEHLTGGSINLTQTVAMQVELVGEQTRLAGLRRLMEVAVNNRPRLQTQADRLASWFVAALLIIAAIGFVVWWQIDPQRALWILVSVLVVSCPCALSLATPVAATVAIDRLNRLGIVVRRADALETLAQSNYWMFDKTGTLSDGQFQIAEQILAPSATQAASVLRAIAAVLERSCNHPLASAFAADSAELLPQLSDARLLPGCGVQGVIAGQPYYLGNTRWLTQLGIAFDDLPEHLAGVSQVVLANSAGWLASFALRDKLRPEAATVLMQLQQQKMALGVLSGDKAETVASLAKSLSLSPEQCFAEYSPEQKQACLAGLQAGGKKLVMVGDGLNDGPVLAQANVSVAMSSGADLTCLQADVVLRNEGLADLPQLLHVARAFVAVVRGNFAWAIAYNLIAIPLALSGVLTPWMSAIGMSASSLLVVLHSLRLRRV